jgi:L-gulonolactone oxidase
VSCRPARREEPESLEDVVRIVKDCRARGGRLRVAGRGHSFSALVATEDALLSLRRWQGLVAVDASSGEARVRAGTTLRRLNEELFARGLALENLGDIDRQAVAGAVATGTHGTGRALGSLSTQVAGMTFVNGHGEVVECVASEPEALAAARLSLGALGVVTEVRLRVVPAYVLRYVNRPARLDECLANLDAWSRQHRHLEFFWLPHTDVVQLKTMDRVEEPAGRGRLARRASELLVENGGLFALCAAGRLRPRSAPTLGRLAARLVGRSEGQDWSHRALCNTRTVRFQEMEYAMPLAEVAGALEELRGWIQRERVPLCIPVEVRVAAGDDILLSPSHGGETAFVAVHVHRGPPWEPILRAAEAVLRPRRGRPHWGKWHGLAASDLRPLYPRWDSFQAARRRHDPQGMFGSPYLDRVLGAAGEA